MDVTVRERVLGVVVADVGVVAAALVDAEVVEAALLLAVVVVDRSSRRGFRRCRRGNVLVGVLLMFGAVFGAAPGAAGHPAGW